MHGVNVKTIRLLGLLALMVVFLPAHAAEKTTYFHFDALGSPVAATDQAGNVVWKEEYRPYGARIKQEPAAASNTRWYTGHPQDEDTGLTYMGARYYDPVVGRFMAIDPKDFTEDNLHSFNRYAYANNNPYKFVDPDGNVPIETVLDAGFVIYDAGRFLGAGVAYAVGTVTGNEALTATALEGLQETSIDLGASATGFVIPYVPATVTRSLTAAGKATRGTQKPVVIGENMKDRVIPTAKNLGADYYRPRRTSGDPMAKNRRWIKQKIREGREIIDIGPDPKRQKRSPFHEMERDELRKTGYPIKRINVGN